MQDSGSRGPLLDATDLEVEPYWCKNYLNLEEISTSYWITEAEWSKTSVASFENQLFQSEWENRH